MIPLGQAAAAAFPARQLTGGEAAALSHGGALAATGDGSPGPVAAFGPDGTFIALIEDKGGRARPVAVFVP